MAIEKTGQFQLTVFAVPDFNLVLPALEGQAWAGQTFPVAIQLSSVDQFAGEIDLSVEGLPAGATAEFLPGSKVTIAPGHPASVQMNVHLPADNSIVGVHDLLIKAVSTNYNGQ